MKLTPRVFIIALALIVAPALVTGKECINYEKGSFSGNVTSKDICRDACQMEPEFSTTQCTVNAMDGNMTVETTTTLYKCTCISSGSYGATSKSSLCNDSCDASGADSLATGLVMAITAIAAIGLALQ
jgi:hypothetical protein